MLIFIPLAEGQLIPNTVLLSLAAQSVPCDIVPLVTAGIYDSNHDRMNRHKRLDKLTGEVGGRNKAKFFLKNHYQSQRFVAMMDSDMVLDDYKIFTKAVDFLMANQELSAVSMPKIIDSHWDLAVSVFRSSFLISYDFHIDDRLHLCKTVEEDCKCAIYPSDISMCHEIQRKCS